ncbi:MAG: polymer-forming cytoskeletal protein [Candidatus Firestonebacteria bacterium]
MFGTKIGDESKVSKVCTVVGPEAEIRGTITSKATIRIDGKIDGGVISEGDVIIGKDGKVKGDIEAKNISISGKTEGNADASVKLEITSGGQLFGDIKAPSVVISNGGIFEGNCQMLGKEHGKIVEIADEKKVKSSTH